MRSRRGYSRQDSVRRVNRRSRQGHIMPAGSKCGVCRVARSSLAGWTCGLWRHMRSHLKPAGFKYGINSGEQRTAKIQYCKTAKIQDGLAGCAIVQMQTRRSANSQWNKHAESGGTCGVIWSPQGSSTESTGPFHASLAGNTIYMMSKLVNCLVLSLKYKIFCHSSIKYFVI